MAKGWWFISLKIINGVHQCAAISFLGTVQNLWQTRQRINERRTSSGVEKGGADRDSFHLEQNGRGAKVFTCAEFNHPLLKSKF